MTNLLTLGGGNVKVGKSGRTEVNGNKYSSGKVIVKSSLRYKY